MLSAKTGRLFRLAGHLRGTEKRGPGKGVAMARRAVGTSGQGNQCQTLGTADAARGEIR